MKTIKELRENHGWTQLDLANKLGVTPSTIYNWERGKFEPRLGQARDLARALGVRLDEIEFVTTERDQDALKKRAA